jgi:hypothetical protein
MYEANGLEPLYISFNDQWLTSVYVFAIGARHPERWRDRIGKPFALDNARGDVAGVRAIPGLRRLARQLLRR